MQMYAIEGKNFYTTNAYYETEFYTGAILHMLGTFIQRCSLLVAQRYKIARKSTIGQRVLDYLMIQNH
jgi:hypothetical protein